MEQLRTRGNDERSRGAEAMPHGFRSSLPPDDPTGSHCLAAPKVSR